MTVQIAPEAKGPLVVAPVHDGLCTFEFGIVAEVFGLSRPEMGPGWYRLASVAVEAGPLRAQGGLRVVADAPLALLEEADLIVVPGWRSVEASVPEALLRGLRAAHGRGARVAAICSGAFVLAAAGLLDGATATTHWRYAETLRARFPAVAVDDAALYRQEGRVFTSAGSAAGIDLLIEIVRQDFGPEVANSVARRLVMPAHRAGGQVQFLERPVPRPVAGGLGPMMDRVRAEPARAWTVAAMAEAAGMSPRSFQRHFRAATGQTPAAWLAVTRIEHAKALLTADGASIERIAEAAGFASPFTFRRQFRQIVGIPPRAFRAQFLAGAESPKAIA